jgi:hypothetical protein
LTLPTFTGLPIPKTFNFENLPVANSNWIGFPEQNWECFQLARQQGRKQFQCVPAAQSAFLQVRFLFLFSAKFQSDEANFSCVYLLVVERY